MEYRYNYVQLDYRQGRESQRPHGGPLYGRKNREAPRCSWLLMRKCLQHVTQESKVRMFGGFPLANYGKKLKF